MEVARLESGHTPSRRVPAYWNSGNIPWLSLKDIRNLSGKYVFDTADKPTALGIQHSSARVLPRGTVALCRTASVGKAAVLGVDMATSQDFVNWVPGDEISPEYLYWAFQSSQSTFELEKQGSTHQTIYMPTVERFQVLLPPLAEQRRIAEILDKADALWAKRRVALAQLDTLTQSIFLDMFGDPRSNPHRWPCVPLKACTSFIQIGPFGSLLHQEDYVVGGVPLVNPKHIQAGVIRPDANESVSPRKAVDLETYRLRCGDIVMGRRGEMGRCAIVRPEHDGFLCGTGSVLVRPDATKATATYLAATLSHPINRRRLERHSLGTTLPNLNRTIVGNFEIVLAPPSAQREFQRRIAAIESIRSNHVVAVTQSEVLFSSVQHRAFRGEL